MQTLSKLSKNSIRFYHPTVNAWCGDVKYKNEFKMKQALKNLEIYVSDNVKPDLKVSYRGEGKEIYEYTDFR